MPLAPNTQDTHTHKDLPPSLEGRGSTEVNEGIMQTHSHTPQVSVGVLDKGQLTCLGVTGKRCRAQCQV